MHIARVPLRLLVAASAGALLLTACNGNDDEAVDATAIDDTAEDDEAVDAAAEDAGSIGQEFDLSEAEFTVGSKEFTEQLVLGHITRIALESAGATANDEIGLAGTAIVREALEAGEIDLYWEYTGTGWITLLGETEPVPGSEAQYEAVAERDLEENGIRWLPPAPFDNTYAIAVHESAAEELDLETISDIEELLEEEPDEATFCIASEFATRDDGLPGLEDHYGFSFPEANLVLLDEGAIYSEVADRANCNLGEVFATDGRIAFLDLVVLEDDEEFFPVYNPAVTVREETYEEHPELSDLFGEIASRLDTETMQDLNQRVDEGGEFPEEVAEDWLRDEGFID
jgi:osmoprotectant transport system substrate-binding protein